MEEPREIERWKRISVLGSGAFGVVSLWQHTDTDEYIAIKKCKFKMSNHISERQRKRWENEVQIMKTLNCESIVSFKELPKQLELGLLKYNPTKLPLLSMEYCMKGNLRRVLNQVKNLSGLPEEDVRIVLADITNAVSYLHQYKITHRDIKPENIVLQSCDNRPEEVIYKLIDLGYAKELNDSIVSFVGTLHYLAPEIMRTEKYDYSVDYWSLGVVAFEVVCGVLPFLPQYSPMERFSFIEKKKPEHICIYQLHSGSVAYSSELLRENHISMCLKQNLEIWLRHVLQFDPVQRGGCFPNDVGVFDYLLNVLEKKIVTVFSVHTLEFYSYEVNEGILISTLKDWLARDTKVPQGEQVLLSNYEVFDITDDKYVVDILPECDVDFFVFKKGAFINKETFKLPKYVTILFEHCTTKYKWRDLRIIYTKSLFFLCQEEKLIASLKAAFKLCSHYINFLNVKLKDNMQQVHKTISTVLLRVDCYYNLHKNNSNGLDLKSSHVYKNYLVQFHQLLADLEKCVHNANELMKRVDVLCKRQLILDKVLPNVTPIVRNCDISAEIEKATDLITKGDSNEDLTPREMTKIISSALKEKDKLLNNKNFQNYSKAMLVAVKEVQDLQTWMDTFHETVRNLSKAIDDNQKAQYQSLLTQQPRKSQKLLGASLNHFNQWDTDDVIKQNQHLRCQLEDVLGEMTVAHKQFFSEIHTQKKF